MNFYRRKNSTTCDFEGLGPFLTINGHCPPAAYSSRTQLKDFIIINNNKLIHGKGMREERKKKK
tara:strand:- start:846 stop:1037 length:192 start_codon:yes stop_codon:yes gene_type:complete